jgi:hypothetical protein
LFLALLKGSENDKKKTQGAVSWKGTLNFDKASIIDMNVANFMVQGQIGIDHQRQHVSVQAWHLT